MNSTEKIGTERRRSQRVLISMAINVASLDPSLPFSGRCNTIDVSFHGCQFFISRPFKRGLRLRLDVPDTQHTTNAHVIRTMPAVLNMNVKLRKVGVDFEHPGNVWGLESPPPDWAL